MLSERRSDPLLYEDEDEAADDDDWDLAAYRRKNEAERDEAERMRIEALGGTVDSLNLNGGDDSEDDEDVDGSAGPSNGVAGSADGDEGDEPPEPNGKV
jgi:hypothetical protein